MNTTLAAVCVFGGLFLGCLYLWCCLLRGGLHWAKIEGVSTRRVYLCGVLTHLFGLAILSFLRSDLVIVSDEHLALTLLEIAVGVAVPCVCIKVMFKTKDGETFKAWLPPQLQGFVVLAVLYFLVRPYVFESYEMPLNSMAPTIVGEHWEASCPICGGRGYSMMKKEGYGPDTLDMICERFHLSQNVATQQAAKPGDRFLVSKFTKPKRWDIVTFKYPAHPETIYAKRLVGLPGELIHIADGSVWVDMKKLDPPDHIRGITYQVEDGDAFWGWTSGSFRNPARLGPDEYFVLGDFTVRSNDSRYWPVYSDERPSFAVPRSHLEGVATHIYWPPDRMRSLE
ncbi:MAG: signal peptidase I [Planctomycetaceae bacterium]|jgi:signal peptidase I